MKKSLMILAATLSFGGTAAIAQAMQQDAAPPTAQPMPTDTTQPMTATPAAPPAADPAATPVGNTPPAEPSAMSATTTAPAPDTSSYPTCSRTVTDKCVQKAGMGRKRHK